MKLSYEELEVQAKQLKIDADCYKKGMEASNARLVQIAAENAGLNKFIEQSCYVYNGDGSDISDSYIPAHESPMMPVQAYSLLPVAAECLAIRDTFISYLVSENLTNNPDADEQQAYDHCAKWVDAMCETPATDAFLAEVRASAIEHAASERWGSGYVFDELNEFAAQLRKERG